jgi:putative intracellular protease/amidase
MIRWRAISALLVLGAAAAVPALASDLNLRPPETTSDVSHIARYEARFERARPVIAVAGENSGTELTDFVIPYGILSDSKAADVFAVATGSGSIAMRPALTIQPDFTVTSFDERFPDGADYVIVPAVMEMDKKSPPVLVDWIKAQAAKGATIVSICDGALTVAKAGLFKGHRATGHWATYAKRKREYPDTEWLENTRYVADGKVISSAGVTAAIPLSLALVEAIAGTEQAQQVAQDMGLQDWSSAHDSQGFHLSFGVYSLAIRNWLSPATEVGLSVADGVDEIALALTADAFSRTYRSRAYAVAESGVPVRTQRGLTVLPDRVSGKDKMPRQIRSLPAPGPSAQALDHALADIASLYGTRTARFVALQMEYPQ